jgi:hypothetical protein
VFLVVVMCDVQSALSRGRLQMGRKQAARLSTGVVGGGGMPVWVLQPASFGGRDVRSCLYHNQLSTRWEAH